jgi:hypothetical protein
VEFKTCEQELLEKVGKSGVLQSTLTNLELGIVQRLSKYQGRSPVKPKLKAIYTSHGTLIVPYKYTTRPALPK